MDRRTRRFAARFTARLEQLETRRCLTDLYFGQIVELPIPGTLLALSSGDFDGDGDADIVSQSLTGLAWISNLDGSNFGFLNPVGTKSVADTDSKIQALDIDRDSDLDIVVGKFNGDETGPYWYENVDGRGNFRQEPKPIAIITTTGVTSVASGDSDNDGDVDFFLGLRDSSIVWVENLGTGNFAQAKVVAADVGGFVYRLAVGDIDGDSDLDVIVNRAETVNGGGHRVTNISWVPNLDGKATFGALQSIEETGTEGRLYFGAIADFNGDGQVDIVGYRNESSSAPRELIWYRNSAGTFDSSLSVWPYGDTLNTLQPIDFDRDGDIDLVSGNTSRWLENLDGEGNFSNPRILSVWADVIEDFDMDGDLDAVGGNRLYLNQSVLPPLPSPIKANNDSDLSVAANALLSIPTATLLANDTKAAGASLSVGAVDGRTLQGSSVGQVVETGSLTLDPTGSETLRRLPLGLSVMDQFAYTATDGRSESSALVTVRVDGVNDGPFAANDVATIAENSELLDITDVLLANDSDIDAGDEIRIVAVNPAATKGEAVFEDGRVLYRPGAAFDALFVGQMGEDSIEYTIEDKHGAQSTATMVITIRGESDVPGDLDGNGSADVLDIDLLCSQINRGGHDPLFDLSDNGEVSQADLDTLVLGLLRTTYGDTDLDSVFDSADLIRVFQSGTYEDAIEDNSSWASGDWNCDREFDSSDLIRAFQAGGYRLT